MSNGKKQIKIGWISSVIATAVLPLLHRLLGNDISELIGFGLLIGFSYAAINK